MFGGLGLSFNIEMSVMSIEHLVSVSQSASNRDLQKKYNFYRAVCSHSE